jgi:four helix bundle protein
MAQSKITNFTDLLAWQAAHQLVLHIYHRTKKFPKNEQYGLTDQLRRAAISVVSNIAEGFGRKNQKEKIGFYYYAQASLQEIHSQIIVAHDLGYVSKQTFERFADEIETTGKLISGLIRSVRKKER